MVNSKVNKHSENNDYQQEQGQDVEKKSKPLLKRSPYIKACLNCRRQHLSCDAGRPCQRCIRAGIGDLCTDVERKKSDPSKRPRKTREQLEKKIQDYKKHQKLNLIGNNDDKQLEANDELELTSTTTSTMPSSFQSSYLTNNDNMISENMNIDHGEGNDQDYIDFSDLSPTELRDLTLYNQQNPQMNNIENSEQNYLSFMPSNDDIFSSVMLERSPQQPKFINPQMNDVITQAQQLQQQKNQDQQQQQSVDITSQNPFDFTNKNQNPLNHGMELFPVLRQQPIASPSWSLASTTSSAGDSSNHDVNSTMITLNQTQLLEIMKNLSQKQEEQEYELKELRQIVKNLEKMVITSQTQK